jgi:hypothetical protein
MKGAQAVLLWLVGRGLGGGGLVRGAPHDRGEEGEGLGPTGGRHLAGMIRAQRQRVGNTTCLDREKMGAPIGGPRATVP